MVQYEDFQCPFCLRYTANHEPFLVEEFVKEGLLQIEFKHLPILGAESVTAAIETSCAAQQNRMWEFSNRLFTLQAEAGQHRNERLNIGRFDESDLLAVAEGLQMDTAAFSACQGSVAALDEVSQDEAEATAFGFRGTPSFLINGSPLQSGAPSSNEGWGTLMESFLSEGEPDSAAPTSTVMQTVTATPTATRTPSATPIRTPTTTPTSPPTPTPAPTATATATARQTPTSTPTLIAPPGIPISLLESLVGASFTEVTPIFGELILSAVAVTSPGLHAYRESMHQYHRGARRIV